MKHFILKLSLFLIAAFNTSCHKTPTEPSPAIKTPRQMSWRCDTLTSPDATSIQLLMKNIVAFSPNDVWLCGWCDVSRGLIWHYDGSKWTESNIAADAGGARVHDMAGYSSNDLWAGGYSNYYTFEQYTAFFHYDGIKWIKYPNMGIKGEIIDMCKDNNGNLWACARHGAVFKFSQGKWTADTINISYDQNSHYWLRGIEHCKDRIFIIATVADSLRERFYYVTGDMNDWTVKDSFIVDSPSSILRWGNQGLSSGNTGRLFTSGLGGIWEYGNEKWNQSYKIDCTVYNVFGVNSNYILASGDYQQILFFDGSRWESIFDLFPQVDRSFVFKNGWTNGYETFVFGFTTLGGTSKTLVWHGK